ncbi:uncharacterized protein [Palaemon carinicauda]|uniref:uncharacterized protein n=1 Tax=Palaemon carinicauda TaxID=392227 RepID=UPI0035B5CF10
MKALVTRKEVLMLVLSKVSQHMADAEHLINDKEDDLGGVSEGSEEVESDKVPLKVVGTCPIIRVLPFSNVPRTHPPSNALGESEADQEFKLISMHIELRKLEFEESEWDRRQEREMANIKLEMARLQSANWASSPRIGLEEKLNLGAELKLVTMFDDKNVPQFYKAFERVATRLSWPTELWTVLIQCRLVGKAIRVYNALEEGVAEDSHKVKSLVLEAYDLAPEAYRLRFRNFNKHPAQSFVEFARIKEEQFDGRVQGVSPTPRVLVNRSYPNVGNTGPNNQENRGSCRRGTCYWCNKPGHCQCHARQHYLELNGRSPVALIPDRSNVDISIVDRSVGDSSSVKFLRDTGSVRSLAVKTTLSSDINHTGNFVVLGGFLDSVVSAPLINVHLSFAGYSRITELAVVDSLPIPGIVGILGNDMLDGEGRELFPILSVNVCSLAITTRSTARAANLFDGDNDDDLLLSSIELDLERPGSVESSGSDVVNHFNFDQAASIKAQKDEFNFELRDVDDLTKPRFGILEGLLYRFSRPATDHLGMLKTFHSLPRCFGWPGMRMSVKQFIRECDTCQVMGKPNQCIPKATLHPIPAIGKPFSEYGLPRVIQKDCGTNFTSKVFRGKCAELAIQHNTSIPYHPESQGLVERFHQTLKSVLKEHCHDSGSEWDKDLPFSLFAIRSHPNSSTGVAPFELVFGHKVRGPLEIMFEVLKSSQNREVKVGGLGEDLRSRMLSAWKFARENLKLSKSRMKENFDKKVKVRSFEPGEIVLVLSMEPDCFLEPRYKGP